VHRQRAHLARASLLRQLKARRKAAAFIGEVDRRERVLARLRQTCIAGIWVPVATEVSSLKLAGLPTGVTVVPGRIEVQFNGAREAVARLFALARAANPGRRTQHRH
jgi:hypothetical protein